ncbi:uncharacterized protein At1g28695-like [Salvia miltiorrhiza]|uniref:uncharacterized protein At1g28695-like n=1 Tax=Salvia miltiorrhiza TaxID=226208 RepID=UPI0025AD3E29|nr:uncharacterized protein At1g28695-like [Salvia miltiorrhiza]
MCKNEANVDLSYNRGSVTLKHSWVDRDELRIVLEKVSTPNKTVIITVINEAYVEPYPSMFDLFLEGFWIGEKTRPLLRHLLVVSMDKTAHERCRFRRLNCYLLTAEEEGGGGNGIAGEKLYMSEEFIEMMWRRTAFLLGVLKRGYNFIFTDTDIIWVRNPFSKLMNNDGLDLQISTDRFTNDPLTYDRRINTGFYYIRSSNKTTSFFKKWYDTRSNATGMKEQDVLQMLISEMGALREFNITIRYLDTKYFSGFCRDSPDAGSVITVHANCCRTIKAKLVDLKAVFMDLKRFNVGNSSSNFRWSPHMACAKSRNT